MNELSRSEVEAFFGNLRYRLGIWDRVKGDVDVRLAGDFNVFDYVDPKEPLLSRIIADLLDPAGKHGQRSAFLRAFVRMVAPRGDYPFEVATVTCESQTTHIRSARRRIDIKIDFGGAFGIGIENKPWAEEQIQQLADYRDQLEREFGGRFILVYLTRSEDLPTSISLEDIEMLRSEGRFHLITFQGQLSEWLAECVKEAQADKVRWFLSDLLDYIRRALPTEGSLEGAVL